MGADFISYRYKGTREQVLKAWNSDVEQSIYENGHGGNYTGSISELGKGFQDTGKVFDSFNEADDWLSENHRKWSCAMAVRYRDSQPVKGEDNKRKKLYEKSVEIEKSFDSLKKKLLQDIVNAKSKTISCKSCDSKINRSFLKSYSCPVCSKTLLSPTAETRLQNLRSKNRQAFKDYENFKPKIKKGGKEMWLVGGWCSS